VLSSTLRGILPSRSVCSPRQGPDAPHTPSVDSRDNDRIPRTSRRMTPEAPAGARLSPQRQGRKALLSRVIPAYPRRARGHHDRPVTPEVAGSSPVAPVKLPANWHIVLSVLAPDSRRPHKRLFEAARNGQKRAETVVEGHEFKPFCGLVETAAKAACDHTKRPEVKAPRSSVSHTGLVQEYDVLVAATRKPVPT
jgi:hypothetical protein